MQYFTLEEKDQIAHLVLNRPEQLNTMGPAFWRELDAILRQLNREGKARALVISSTGKHFSAGMALDTFDTSKDGHVGLQDQTPEGRAAVFDSLLDIQSTFNLLEELRMPVIAVVHGGCIGGAVDLLSACCLRYASADAFFCIQEINIGMVADLGTLQRLPKLMPLAIVKELAYTGRRLPAARALTHGLVNEVFETQAQALTAALACAREIAAKPPVAIWGTKQAIHYARDHSVEESLKQMGWLQGAIWSNAHVAAAVQGFQNKTAPEFPALDRLHPFTKRG
jgi:enoyl-CoA hydratase